MGIIPPESEDVMSTSEARRAYRLDRKSRGLCLNCPTPAVFGKVLCRLCQDKNAERFRRQAAGERAPVSMDTPTRLMTAEQIRDAAARFLGGETLDSIAESVGVKRTTLHHTLVRRGVKVDRPGGRRTTTSDVHCFDDPESSEEAAYFIGLLITDGSVSDRGCVSLSLDAEDRHTVERLSSFLGGKYKVRTYTPKPGDGRHGRGDYVRISFQSTHVTKTLNSYGIVPRKGCVAVLADSLTSNRHVWRGAVDGDGSLFFDTRRHYPILSLVGSERFVTQFAAFVQLHCPEWKGSPRPAAKSIYQTVVSGRHAKVLARVLYTNSTVHLDRKKLLADQFMAWEPQRIRTD